MHLILLNIIIINIFFGLNTVGPSYILCFFASTSWGGGGAPWGPEKDDKFSQPNHWDGQLEVLGVTGVVHLGQIQSGLRSAIRLVQASKVVVVGSIAGRVCNLTYNINEHYHLLCTVCEICLIHKKNILAGKPYQDSHQFGAARARGRGALDPGARRHRRAQVGPEGEGGHAIAMPAAAAQCTHPSHDDCEWPPNQTSDPEGFEM